MDYQSKAVKGKGTHEIKKKSDTIHDRIKNYQKEITKKQSENIAKSKFREAK